jgi:hypothetical protein
LPHARNDGGLDAVKHYLIRGLLCVERRFPARIAATLNYACDVILLRRVGAGYVFIHRLLLEHFAHAAHGETNRRTNAQRA